MNALGTKMIHRMQDTTTIRAQREVELSLLGFLRLYNPDVYALWSKHPEYEAGRQEEVACDGVVGLMRRKHMEYLEGRLGEQPESSEGLYPAQPWLAYWSLQAADMLGVTDRLLNEVPAEEVAKFAHMCLAYQPTQGYGSVDVAGDDDTSKGNAERPHICFAGGPTGHIPHLAASYAACCALCILGDPVYLETLPRAAIKRWLLSLRTSAGSFRMHWGGETDIRASYCVSVVTTLLRLDEPDSFPDTELGVSTDDVAATPVLTAKTAQYVAQCQSHEGGFVCGRFASEAHGAYTQCGLASLLMMRQTHLCDLAALRRWLTARQLQFEGGFSGRTNKLVDSCYSHWVGSSHVMLRVAESYSKLLGTNQIARQEAQSTKDARSSARNEEKAVELAAAPPPPPLRAREVLLLDHAQLLDASAISCLNTDAWHRVEAEHLRFEQLTEQLVSAEDDVLSEAVARRNKRRAVALRRQRQSGYAGKEDRDVGLGEEARNNDKESTQITVQTAEEEFANADDKGDYYFNQRKLQIYVLRCCQDTDEGGLVDKPGCPNDAYHTCYSLSGMSSAQNTQYVAHAQIAGATKVASASTIPRAPGMSYVATALEHGYLPQRLTIEQQRSTGLSSYGVVLGLPGPSPEADVSVLRTTNPIFNLHRSRVLAALNMLGPKTFL